MESRKSSLDGFLALVAANAEAAVRDLCRPDAAEPILGALRSSSGVRELGEHGAGEPGAGLRRLAGTCALARAPLEAQRRALRCIASAAHALPLPALLSLLEAYLDPDMDRWLLWECAVILRAVEDLPATKGALRQRLMSLLSRARAAPRMVLPLSGSSLLKAFACPRGAGAARPPPPARAEAGAPPSRKRIGASAPSEEGAKRPRVDGASGGGAAGSAGAGGLEGAAARDAAALRKRLEQACGAKGGIPADEVESLAGGIVRVLEACDAARVGGACEALGLSGEVRDEVVARVVALGCGAERSSSWALALLAGALLPRARALASAASRTLMAGVAAAAKERPTELVDAVLLPLLRGDPAATGSARCDLVLRAARQRLPDGALARLVAGLCEGGGGGDYCVWTDATVPVVTALLGLKQPLPAAVGKALSERCERCVQAGGGEADGRQACLAGSLRFGALLHALSTKRRDLAAPHKEALLAVAQACTSFMAKPAAAALGKL